MAPTRAAGATESVLDLAFVNNFPDECSVDIADGISDHKLVYVISSMKALHTARASQSFLDFTSTGEESILDSLYLPIGEIE